MAHERSSFSSDAHALNAVFNQEGWTERAAPPEHLRWNLAATKDAFHVWHIDSDGYGTFVNVVAGSKWWIVARPKDSPGCDLNTSSLLVHEEFSVDNAGENLFDVEAILLQPGSELYVVNYAP